MSLAIQFSLAAQQQWVLPTASAGTSLFRYLAAAGGDREDLAKAEFMLNFMMDERSFSEFVKENRDTLLEFSERRSTPQKGRQSRPRKRRKRKGKR
jgi:hypothetical protein